MRITNFGELKYLAKTAEPIRLVVAGGEAHETAKAVELLLDYGFVKSVYITGDCAKLPQYFRGSQSSALHFVEAATPQECATKAVEIIRSGQGNVLMKGHIDSTAYLRAVVDRDKGLREGGVLSNVTVAEIPHMHRFLVATDNGIVPNPDLNQKRQIVLNTAPLFRGLGISPVKVAAVCASEKISEALPSTIEASALAKENAAGGFQGFELGGPMGYDVAISPEAAKVKGLEDMPAAGAADLLLFPNIDAANAVAKSWKFHGNAETGSLVLGAQVPVLLNSRSDRAERRMNALLLAAAVLKGRKG